MITHTERADWPSPSDLVEYVEVVYLEEPLSPEDEEMLPIDPATVEEPTERHLVFVKRLYTLAS